jgi:16S rRNA (adenine1518-N6/adenine1519-N6)-dimethyltransferase
VSSPSKYSSKYSALSIFISYLAETKTVLEVPRGVFAPVPCVDGMLVIIAPYNNINISKEKLISFLRFLKNCFRFRRKTLLNNLNSFAGNKRVEWQKYFAKKEYSENIRPQNLTPNQYFSLFLTWRNL